MYRSLFFLLFLIIFNANSFAQKQWTIHTSSKVTSDISKLLNGKKVKNGVNVIIDKPGYIIIAEVEQGILQRIVMRGKDTKNETVGFQSSDRSLRSRSCTAKFNSCKGGCRHDRFGDCYTSCLMRKLDCINKSRGPVIPPVVSIK